MNSIDKIKSHNRQPGQQERNQEVAKAIFTEAEKQDRVDRAVWELDAAVVGLKAAFAREPDLVAARQGDINNTLIDLQGLESKIYTHAQKETA